MTSRSPGARAAGGATTTRALVGAPSATPAPNSFNFTKLELCSGGAVALLSVGIPATLELQSALAHKHQSFICQKQPGASC